MVVAKQSPYEEFRLRRVEENKKRMEALNLPNLCQTLRLTSVKTSPMKKSNLAREKQLVVVRRSSRISNASSSSPVYKEASCCSTSASTQKGRDLSNRVYVSEEIREEAFSKAEKLQADLRNRFPSFVKSMLQSHVSGGFWLGLPVHFCRSELQKQDGVITLIDEEGEEFETVYLAKRTGLSGGWLGFAVSHNLVYGDALVFELVRPTVFKVYITRVKSSGESPKM
uniref:TF-B3 domain-containing protein n=1 Tax=Brassica campestris TaxID=3711 RepID=M4F2M5_BRACM